jgi:pantothenate synthetase
MTPEQKTIAENLEKLLTTVPAIIKDYESHFKSIINWASQAFTKLPYAEWVKIYDKQVQLLEPGATAGSLKIFTSADLQARWEGA